MQVRGGGSVVQKDSMSDRDPAFLGTERGNKRDRRRCHK